ncbi:hypothetical protein JCGZ_03476 [Jatropha curcas]|uniref:Uncharacterized protein n=1 Tax=Jatropha curcas TaxID=180498 RepID=A0A067L618_JATCU|nr:hypothetical protein JCGZ_03476 [Jatropha curcas]
MENDDPFASIAKLCHISSSQEEHLRRCRFAGELEDDSLSDDEPGDIPVASTGIMMVSPPESFEESETDDNLPLDSDIFHTPAEEATLAATPKQQQAVAVNNPDDRSVEGVANDKSLAAVDGNYTDDSRAVDLGRDTDLGFSATVELTERIAIDSEPVSSPGANRAHDSEVIRGESINFRIMKRVLAPSDCLCKSPVTRSNTVDKHLGSMNLELCLGFEAEKILDRVVKSTEKLKSRSKKSELLDENMVLDTSRDTLGTGTEILGKSVENLNFEGISPDNYLKSVQNHQIGEEVTVGDLEFHEGSSAKKKLDFDIRSSESHSQENTAVLGFNEDGVEGRSKEIKDSEADKLCKISKRYSIVNSPEKQNANKPKSIDDIEKFRYVGPTGVNSSKKRKIGRARRALPLSLRGNNRKIYTDSIVLNVLSILTKDYNCDPSLNNLSVLEAAKRRGMTFP